MWRRREETWRTIRWAVEMARGPDDRACAIGMRALAALQEAELLQGEDLPFLLSVTDAVIGAGDGYPIEVVEDLYAEVPEEDRDG